MLGFRKLRLKIDNLDYKAYSQVVRIAQQLEHYIHEAKKLNDGVALEAAHNLLKSWREATNKTPSELLDHVQVTNLTRCRAAIQWLERLF